MKPDHEAAKKWAKRMRWTPEALTEEEINFARAYLDLLAQLEQLKADKGRAVKLLRRFEKFYGKPTPTLRDDVHDFLAERGEV